MLDDLHQPAPPQDYLQAIDALYQRDAYHSLSIEGYQVSQALIDRVRAGDWAPVTSSTRSRWGKRSRPNWSGF